MREWRNSGLLCVCVLVLLLPWQEAPAHGQKVVPARAAADSVGRTFEVSFSFDVAWLFENTAVEITRDWLNRQPAEDLSALASDAEALLREEFQFTVGGRLLEGVFRFPDLDALPQEGYDNGEPEGNLLIHFAGEFPPSGGDFSVVFGGARIPSSIITPVLDEKVPRRLVVLMPGEERVLFQLPGDGSAVPEEADGLVDSGSEPTGTEVFWAFFRMGYDHVLPWGYDHFLLALAVFVGVRGARELVGQMLVLAVATLAAAALRSSPVALGETDFVTLAGVVLLAFMVLLGKLPWPVTSLVLAATGVVHGASLADSVLAGTGAGATARVAICAGLGTGGVIVLSGSFVLLGWSWGEPFYRRAIVLPGSVIALAGAVALAIWR